MQTFEVKIRVTTNTLEDNVTNKEVKESMQELLDNFDGGVATVVEVSNFE